MSAGFEQAWEEYHKKWAPAIDYGKVFKDSDLRNHFPYDRYFAAVKAKIFEQEEPNPECDDFFDPGRHDGGLALTLGIDHWRGEVNRAKVIANKCQIALDALDFVRFTIGIDINGIFKR